MFSDLKVLITLHTVWIARTPIDFAVFSQLKSDLRSRFFTDFQEVLPAVKKAISGNNKEWYNIYQIDETVIYTMEGNIYNVVHNGEYF